MFTVAIQGVDGNFYAIARFNTWAEAIACKSAECRCGNCVRIWS